MPTVSPLLSAWAPLSFSPLTPVPSSVKWGQWYLLFLSRAVEVRIKRDYRCRSVCELWRIVSAPLSVIITPNRSYLGPLSFFLPQGQGNRQVACRRAEAKELALGTIGGTEIRLQEV